MKKLSLQFGMSLLAITYAAMSSSQAAAIVQESGVDYLAFQGEAVDQVLNPDAANDVQYSATTGSAESPIHVWTVVADSSALGGSALQAPPSPHKQLVDVALQESVAVFPLIFASAGTYQCYMRVRNDGTPSSGSTDSMWAPSDWDETNPSDALSTGNTGSYEWKEPGSFLVSAGQLGATLEFRVGVREPLAHLDAVVFSQQTSLDDATLDSMVEGGIPPEPPGEGCVSTMAELNAAIAAAQPGDTILMCNGVWNNVLIDFDTDGLPGQPITLRAEVDGQVTLEGTSTLQIDGDYLVVQGLHFTNGGLTDGPIIEFRGSSGNANNSRLTECAITDYNPVSSSTEYKWVSVYGLSNRVDHCSFDGMNHKGVTLTIWLGTGAPANHTLIDNNYFANHASGGGENGWETIRIGTSTRSEQDSEAIVEDNYFYRCDGEIEIISNKSVGNIFRRNTFESCKGQLTLRHGHECLVEGNFFLGNGVSGSSGVRVIGRDHTVVNNYFENLAGTGFRAALGMMNGVPDSPLNRYIQVENALIAFNTFAGCEDNFVIGLESSDGDTIMAPIDCVIANNIVEGSSSPLIEYRNTPTNMQYEANIFYGAALGITQPSGITIVDPLLSLATDGLMRLATNSPAIDAATGSYPGVAIDMDGDARVAGTKDIGADELALTPPIYGPLGADDVGPRWMKPSTLSIVSADVNMYDAEIVFEDSTGLAPSYDLERSEDLTTNDWSVVATYVPVAYTSTVFSVTDPTTNGPAAFWRVSCD